MAFSTKEFPGRVFETFEEYKIYKAIRTKVKKRLENKVPNKVKVVKVSRVEKKTTNDSRSIKRTEG